MAYPRLAREDAYDPRGLGYGAEYLDQACGALSAEVRRLTSAAARPAAPGLMNGKLTYYRWIKEFYKGSQAHVGKIMAIKALMARKNA